MTRRRRFAMAFAGVGAAVLLPIAALVVAAAFTPLPAVLVAPAREASLEVVDRSGRLIREVRTENGELTSRVRLSEVSGTVVPALLAAEDARFYAHVGVDPLAVVRALFQAVREGHVVSGASTITQQLARTVVPRPRTLGGKFREMALALRIERSLDKRRILEEYLTRAPFGPNVRGIDAASRLYLDKPAARLDLAESAELAALVRGPTLYDPRRRATLTKLRRDRVLERMRRQGLADGASIDRALKEPLQVQSHREGGGALHLALGLARGTLPSGLPGVPYTRIETTLDAGLQREVETLVRTAQSDVERFHVTALSALVVDNASGEVLAYVGSPDYFSAEHGGANDGVSSLRQPGSTLKPFVYAAAMERLGATAATLLPDVELTLDTPEGPYTPKNYDGRTHGPVRLREALASSLNVPAVYAASEVGPDRVLDVLHRVGLRSLGASATRYGAAIALGDGEVRLSELAEAYATLARGGVHAPLSLAKRGLTPGGTWILPDRAPPTRALDARTAAVLTDILSDDAARAGAFGRGSALELPFPVAAKTGTSKGYRDNWAVGFSHEVTVAVWAGNFDGEPMAGSSGITGAAPLFHSVMLAAMRGKDPAPLVDREGLVEVEVCVLSGERPSAACPHRVHELFQPDRVPRAECSLHVHTRVDPSNGLLAGPACTDAVERTFETYPPRYAAWAASARRPLPPEASSPRCPALRVPAGSSALAAIRFPHDGARFVFDPAGPERQEIVLAARPAEGDPVVRFRLDGRPLAATAAPFELPWSLVRGVHRLEAETSHGRSEPVTFEVLDDARPSNALTLAQGAELER